MSKILFQIVDCLFCLKLDLSLTNVYIEINASFEGLIFFKIFIRLCVTF